jgi:eukaryotic-like serine/threonine-protein kinase
MTLPAGTRLGPYEILAPLGAGGMGEVYRARDTRLERTVAVKVLPSHLSSSPELRQRFEREAKTISQLSHSHICALYDVGSEGETEYLVMEYLEGETLTDRLARGSLSTEQLLRYGVEISDALDKAHRQGIVHRDLKPGNVMITKSGVKLLDFGLAKAMAPTTLPSALTSLPTMAGQNLTEAGTILGTFQYMAPEQLEGKEADGRSDIFAFGAVLYEMATSRKAFVGKSQASLIAAILEHEPPSISSVQPLAPPALDRVVRKCLAKDPDERWQNAADLGSELKWIAEAGSQAGVPAKIVAKRKDRERVAWIGFALAGIAAGMFAYGFVRRTPVAQHAIRSSILVPPKTSVGMLAVSPDGTQLAFNAFDTEGKSLLWLRPLDGTAARPVAGSEGALFPFWSPDSQSIGFFADKKLKRVEATGAGSPIAICDAPNATGGAWGRDGVILMGQGAGPLLRVLASGGTPAPATRLDTSRHETSHRYPAFLPDGRHFLYLALDLAGAPDNEASGGIWAGGLDDTRVERVTGGYSNPVYASGYLLVGRGGNLVAQSFDPRSLRLKGEPRTIVQQVGFFNGFVNLGQFSASEGGILVCAGSALVPWRLQWVDRTGRRLAFVGEPALYYGFYGGLLSPDGKRAVVEIYEPNIDKSELWIMELESGVRRRLTSGPSGNAGAVWSPDGGRIAFSSDRTHQADLYEKAVSGSVTDHALIEAEGQKLASDWSPDGRYVLYWEREPRGLRRVGLMALPLFGDRKPIVVLEPTSREDFRAKFSPDGRWIAYASDEAGRSEVFVTSFPTPTDRRQISTAGGTMPHWRRDGRELFYVTLDGNLVSVPISVGKSVEAGVPRPLFETMAPGAATSDFYDVAADGQRFLLSLPADTSTPPLNVIVHWTVGVDKK